MADDPPKFALTSTQVVASMSAAVAAAFIGAQLGVAGTILGAAIASIVSVVGSAVIGHSLLLTRRKVTQTVHQVRSGAGAPADAADTVLLTAVTRQVEITRARPAPSAPMTAAPGSPSRWTGWWSRPGRGRRLLVGLAASVAVFAGALGAVTVVEAVTGTPISGGSPGFSVLGGSGGGSGDAPPSSSPTTVTETMQPTSSAVPSSSSPSASTSAPSPTSSSPAPSTTASTTPPTTGPTSGAPTTASSTPAPAAGPAGATAAG